MRTLVKGARLLGGDATDLLLEDDRIIEVGRVDAPTGATVIDADGLVALPGLVDLHCHGGAGGEFGADPDAARTAARHHLGQHSEFGLARACFFRDTPPVEQ